MYGLHGSPVGPEVQASSTSLCSPSSPGSLVAWTRKDDLKNKMENKKKKKIMRSW
jgi:hypothetical protein